MEFFASIFPEFRFHPFLTIINGWLEEIGMQTSDGLVLSGGSEGTVYQLNQTQRIKKRIPHASKLVAKVLLCDGGTKKMKQQLYFAKLAGELGTGPRVYWTKQNSTIALVVMEKLHDYQDDKGKRTKARLDQAMVDKINEQILTMARAGIRYADVHMDNVMFRSSDFKKPLLVDIASQYTTSMEDCPGVMKSRKRVCLRSDVKTWLESSTKINTRDGHQTKTHKKYVK